MKKKIPLILLSLCFMMRLSADEGMWLLTDLKEQNEVMMKEMGLEIPIKEIYDAKGLSLKDAVVIFGRGCTAEVISESGLVLTNHHCGYGNIQQLSSVANDYLTEGYWAKSRGEELPCKGLTITFISEIYEVTSFVQEQLAKDDDPQGTNYLSPSYLRKVASRFALQREMKDSPYVELELKPFYGGNKYYLFVKKIYQDIRLVGAPPSAIGKFGSDTDNWMWPRHTGDFTLFRIYADEKGDPAPYSERNEPLKVTKSLKISLSGYDEGDFVFLMGFPGSNSRYMIADEVVERMETVNRVRQKVREARLAEMREEMYKDPAVRIHYASIYASSANYWKNAIGMNEGLTRLKVIDKKMDQQQQLLDWGRAQGKMEYQVAFDTIRSIVKQRREPLLHQLFLEEALVRGMEFLKVPSFNSLQESLQKEDREGIEKAIEKLRSNGALYFRNYNAFPEVEKRVTTAMLDVYQKEIERNQQIAVFDVIEKEFDGKVSAYVDSCFNRSILGSLENFHSFLEEPSLSRLLNDPILTLQRVVKQKQLELNRTLALSRKHYQAAHKVWVSGIVEMKQDRNEPVYPDANSTLRLTYGKVLPYQPADAITYDSYTTLQGVMEKEEEGSRDFIVPERLKKLFETKDYGFYANAKGELPVCFIINTDNTGGNSGSPVFNAKGELIGVGFDRNYEGLTGDIAFQPDLQRAVCVDIRYVLFILDKFAGASYLLDELSFVQ